MRKLIISLFVIFITGNTDAQNVGIGTTAPTTKLQVGDYGNGFNNYITVKTAGGNLYKTGLGLYHYNDNYGWLLESDETNSSFSIRHRNGLVFNNPAFTIDQSERVGIGSVSPTTKLQVGDFTNGFNNYISVKTGGGNLYKAGLGLYHFDDNIGWLLESDEINSTFSIRHRNGVIFNNPAFTIDYYENVGIGSVSPTTKLQVGDYSNGFNNYITVKTAGGNLYKTGVGLYHHNDNYGWLLESDEINSTFSIRHRNGVIFNNPAFTIDYFENVGIGSVSPTTKLQVGDYSNGFNNYISVKTTGGNLYKAGLGLYHLNENVGWLLESDETNATFSIRHRNGAIFNNPAFTIDYFENVGIGSVNPTTKLQVGDYTNDNDTYLTIKTTGGNVHKSGLGLYHYNDNYGWLMESDEVTSYFSLRHRNGPVFNNPVLTINQTENWGIGELPYTTAKVRLNSGGQNYGLYVEGASSAVAGLWAIGKSVFDVGTRQMVIKGPASGGTTTTDDSYPLMIEGAQQGIGIHINSFDSHEGNNFLYFRDHTYIRGSVAGQNMTELHNSVDYIWFQTMFGFEEGFVLAQGIACAAQLDLGEVAVMAVEGAVMYANWAEELINMENSVGVVYQSNAADYAEWLERAESKEQLEPGMIVGVNGGRVSKRTVDTKHLMVISTAPLVLGNTPPEGRKSEFEKVAFMGQVPVRVSGKADVGDYILASGQNDGMGIAVAPANMRLEDYDRVVGIAWSSSKFSNGESLIKTAVGLNTHDLIGEIKQQKTEVQQLKETLSGVMAYLKEKDPAFKLDMPAGQTSYAAGTNTTMPAPTQPIQTKKLNSPANLNQVYEFLKNSPEFVDDMLIRAKEICVSRGINVNTELTKGLFDRNAFYQRLEKAISHKVVPKKTKAPVKGEQLKRIEQISVKD